MERTDHRLALRATVSGTALTAALSLTVAAVVPTEGWAQQRRPQPATPPATDAVQLETIDVEAGTPTNTLQSGTGLARRPGTVQETPQVVNVVPQQVLEQQNVQTLEQALRNVPGVTVAIGEGNGGLNGDQFRIRGFEAKGDIYVDGLRDFGVYTRDSFNMEQVEVLKGPSAEAFGMGTTGGAINSSSKTPKLDDFYHFGGAVGNGPLGRGTIDINKRLGETTAVRINALAHGSDIVDRDHVFSNRFGFAPSIGFGIGTPTTLNLSYFYQHTERRPDYGVPMVVPPPGLSGGAIGRPVTEFGIPRSTYYGKSTDEDISDVHILTSRFRHEANNWLTITNDTRVSFYNRDFATSVPGCSADSATVTYAASCAGQFFAGGNPTLTFGGGNPSYRQESWGAQNITTGIADFRISGIRNLATFGVDIFHQDDYRMARSTVGTKTGQQIRNPVFQASGYSIVDNPNSTKNGNGTQVGFFVSDRIWLTDQLSVLGGIRFDNYHSTYDTFNGTTTTRTNSTSEIFSPKASIIYEPTKDYNFYASYATSASPPGQYVTNAANTLNAGQPSLDPEKNESFEIGAKASLLGGRLGLTGAVFRVNKSNAFYTDPGTGDLVATGEKQRVQGVEVGVTGKITKAWTVLAAYTYLDSEVLTGASTGNEVGFVPRNAFSIWTTYDLTSHFATLPGKLEVGGGVVYRDEYFTTSANTYQIPATFSLDAFLSYEFDRYRIALNGYNLTNNLNYDAGFSSRAIVGQGRAGTISVSAKF